MTKTLDELNSKQQTTLKELFTDPISATISWKDVESLFLSLGADVNNNGGSRVSVILNDTVGHFHKPHPRKETDKGTIKSVRFFLRNAGIRVE